MKKLKICNGCNKDKVIWKSHKGEKFCQECWNKHPDKPISNVKPTITKKQKRIPPRSVKRIAENAIYLQKREVFLNDHPYCEIKIQGICTGRSDQVHHTYAGSNRNKYFLVEETWLATDTPCHQWVHNNPEYARELNLLK